MPAEPYSLPPGQYDPPKHDPPVYPNYPGDALAVEDVHRMRMQAMQNIYDGGPTTHEQAVVRARVPESPHWVSRAPWRPYMFAILSPFFLPVLLVYTVVRGIRAWGQFMGELCEGVFS